MGSFKVILSYLLYASAAVLLFLYLLFPDQAVRAYMENRLTAMDPSLAISAEKIRPSIPPGLKMSGVDLSRDGFRIAHFEQTRVSPVFSTLLNKQKRFQFSSHIADGTINGWALMEGSASSGRLRVEADLSDIKLERLDALQSITRFTLTGDLNGRLTHDGARAPQGKVNGLLTSPNLRVTLKADLFGISELTMTQTEADFSVDGQTMRLKSLTFEGPMMEGRINGTIELAKPFERSRLNLTGNVKPRPELFTRLQETIPEDMVNPRTLGTRGLNFRVYGSVGNPDVSMR
jgi:type II secretion system protein N